MAIPSSTIKRVTYAAGTGNVVAGVANTRYRIVALSVSLTGAGTVALSGETGGNILTVAVQVGGDGLVFPMIEQGWCETASSGEALVATVSAGTAHLTVLYVDLTP